jgi:phosphatidylinositol glycan class T
LLFSVRIQLSPELNWQKVTSELSGQFCASINFIEKPICVQPKLSFRPQSTVNERNNSFDARFGFYATLPTETICTENLTPWKKLLPCFGRAGLARLLNAIPLLNSNYLSLSLDYQPICSDSSCENPSVSVRQSLAIVFTPPAFSEGKQSWSLIKLFGNSIRNSCSLSTHSHVLVDVSRNSSHHVKSILTPTPSFTLPHTVETPKCYERLSRDLTLNNQEYAVYDVNEELANSSTNKFNIANIYSSEIDHQNKPLAPPLTASRHLTGYSVASGGVVTRIQNRLAVNLSVNYLEVVPWYLRIYTHTLKIRTSDGQILTPIKLYYLPAKDRQQPHHLELETVLPPHSETIISYDFEKGFLKWTEYPPDANHGVYVGPAIVSAHIPLFASNLTFDPVPGFSTDSQSDKAQNTRFIQVHTQPLLINLPTPDFSMPYNVICLVSTVVSLAFGPFHNLTTKRVSLIQPVTASKSLIKRFIAIFSRK